MRCRLRAAVLVVGVLALLSASGCLSALPSEGEVSYEDRWETNDTVTYYLDDGTYTAVVSVDGMNGTEIEIWQRDPFGGDNPVNVAGVRFRNSSGVVNVSDDAVDTSGDRTVVELPATEGRLAYVAERGRTTFLQPTPVSGDVRVRLQPGTDARNLFLGRISPDDYEVVAEEPLVLRWEDVERGTFVRVEHYRRGYPWLFAFVIAGLLVAALGVVYYYRRVLTGLREERERKEG